MKKSCDTPHRKNAHDKDRQQQLFILAIADRGIVSHAKAFADERLAHEALAEYLRENHGYSGPDDIQDIIEWLNQHDEYLSVEIIQQDVVEPSDLVNAACEVIEWAERMGGWDAPCWDRLRKALGSVTPAGNFGHARKENNNG